MTWEDVCPEKGATSNFPKSCQKSDFFNRPGQKKKDESFKNNNNNNNDESGWRDNKYKCTKVTHAYI